MGEFFKLLKKGDFRSLFILPTENTIIQLFRYCFVGGIAFLVDAGTLYLCVDKLGIIKYAGVAIAFVFGLISNFLLSKLLVFTQKAKGGSLVEFIVYAIIGVIGLGLTELLIWLLSDVLPLHYMLAKIIAAAVVLIWNFVARKLTLYSKKS